MGKKVRGIASRLIVPALALALGIAILMGGTYAWQDIAQVKTNVFEGEGDPYNVTLIDVFNPEDADEWTEGSIVNKDVSVKNVGEEPVYVRLTLKEYMDITLPVYEYYDYYETEYRFATYWEDGWNSQHGTYQLGEFIWDDDRGQAETLAMNYGYEATDVVGPITDALTGNRGYYIRTAWEDINGQYGKKLVDNIIYPEDGAEPVIPGTERGLPTDFEADKGDPDEDLTWAKYFWDEDPESNQAIRKYIDMNLVNIVPLNQFDSASGLECWVYNNDDPTDPYIYWSLPLEAGVQTKNIIDSLMLTEQPEGRFYYGNRFELDAVSIDDLDKWYAPEMIGALYGEELKPSYITPYAYGSSTRLGDGSVDALGFAMFESEYDLDLSFESGNRIDIALQYATGVSTTIVSDDDPAINWTEVGYAGAWGGYRNSYWSGIFNEADPVTGTDGSRRYPKHTDTDARLVGDVIPAGTLVTIAETSTLTRYPDVCAAVGASGPEAGYRATRVRTVLRLYNNDKLVEEVIFPSVSYFAGGSVVYPIYNEANDQWGLVE